MIQITINDDKEVEIKTTKGLEETELAANAVIEIMRMQQHDPVQHDSVEQFEYELILTKVNKDCKIRAAKEVYHNTNLDLKMSKHSVDSCAQGNSVTLMAGTKNEVQEVFAKFNNSEFTKVEMRKV